MRGDEAADLGVKLWAADRGVGLDFQPPVEPEALAVPGQNSGGLHDDETGPANSPRPVTARPTEDAIPPESERRGRTATDR